MTEDHIGIRLDGVIYVKLDHVKPMRDRIEELEEQAHYANGVADLAMKHRDYAEQRVEKLEAALREIDQTSDNFTNMSYAMFTQAVRNTARKALEGKDDPQTDL
jgi:hypothetical protein